MHKKKKVDDVTYKSGKVLKNWTKVSTLLTKQDKYTMDPG